MKTILTFLLSLFVSINIYAQINVTYLEGEVLYSKFDNGKWYKLNENTELEYGYIIDVKDNAFLQLSFEDSSVLNINEMSQILLENENSEVQGSKVIGLNFGSINADVKKITNNAVFEVQTPEMVVGVRGTEFNVSYETEEEAEVSVEQGEIEVALLEDDNIIQKSFVQKNNSAILNLQKNKIETIKKIIDKHKTMWQHFKNKREMRVNRIKILHLSKMKKNLQRKLKTETKFFRKKMLRNAITKIDDKIKEARENFDLANQRFEQQKKQYMEFRKKQKQKREMFAEKMRDKIRERFESIIKNKIKSKLRENQEKRQEKIEQFKKETNKRIHQKKRRN
jgi:hypothetical protein